MTARLLVLLGLFLPASTLACMGSGSDADSRWEGAGCEPACVADDYNLPGYSICTMPGYLSCVDGGDAPKPTCPGGETPTCDEGPPTCADGSKPSGCQ